MTRGDPGENSVNQMRIATSLAPVHLWHIFSFLPPLLKPLNGKKWVNRIFCQLARLSLCFHLFYFITLLPQVACARKQFSGGQMV